MERNIKKRDDVGLNPGTEAFPPVSKDIPPGRYPIELSYLEAQTLMFLLRRVTGHVEKSRLQHLIPLRDRLTVYVCGSEQGYRDSFWHGGRAMNLLDGALVFRTEDARAEYPIADAEKEEPVVVEDRADEV